MATQEGKWRVSTMRFMALMLIVGVPWASQGNEPDASPLKMSQDLLTPPEKTGPTIVQAPVLATELPQSASPPLGTAAIPIPYRQEYRMGPDDLVEIQVFGVEQMSRTVRINTRGQIALPLVGAITIGGLTSQEAEAAIAARLGAQFLQDPQVSLFIKEYTSQRITVEGAVNRPGIYPMRGPTSLLQALALAGGQGTLSNMNEVMIFRNTANGTREAKSFDVDKIRSGKLEDPQISNDDVIVVKRSPKREALKDSLFRDILDTINPFKW
jgi:polysaccharide export outer membrane protein